MARCRDLLPRPIARSLPGASAGRAVGRGAAAVSAAPFLAVAAFRFAGNRRVRPFPASLSLDLALGDVIVVARVIVVLLVLAVVVTGFAGVVIVVAFVPAIGGG